MLEAVSSSEEACSSVRWDRLRLPAEISCEPVPTKDDALLISSTISLSFSFMVCMDLSNWPVSSLDVIRILLVRSPEAMRAATFTARYTAADWGSPEMAALLDEAASAARGTLGLLHSAYSALERKVGRPPK